MTALSSAHCTTSENSMSSFDEFYRTEWPDLLRYCWALVVEREEARDIAQDAMSLAWREWDAIHDKRPAAWIRTVSLNLSRNRWRSSKRRTTAHTRFRLFQERDVAGEPSAHMELVEALRRLSHRQREAVVLHHLCDLPVEEVAREMGVSISSVKTHLHRGRVSLEPLLRDGAEEQPSHD